MSYENVKFINYVNNCSSTHNDTVLGTLCNREKISNDPKI